MREATFARLGMLAGMRVLDLYAGTGALGIEALSRGAESVLFVEQARAPLGALQKNVAALAISASVRVLEREVGAAVAALGRAGERFDLVLIDPPYGTGEDARALAALSAAGILAAGAMVVVERSRRHDLAPIGGLVLLDERRYGDTIVSRFVAATDVATAGEEGSP